MPNLVVANTETVCGKLKSGNRFLKPNFEPGPNFELADFDRELAIRYQQGDRMIGYVMAAP